MNFFKQTLIILFLFSATLITAQDYSVSGLLDIKEVLEKAKTCTAEAYPNSDEVLVADHIKITYKSDGTGEKWDDTVVKIITDQGRENNKILGFHYNLPYSKIEIKKLEVIKPDGSADSVNISANAKEMVNPSQMYANIYNPNSKILKVTIPELNIGDCLRYVICETVYKSIISNEFFDLEILESTSPVVNFKYEIIAPKDKPILKKAVLDRVSDTVSEYVEETEDNVRYIWEVKNVPRMFPEPNMPPLQSVVQRVLVSTINSWEDVSRWYWNLCLPRLNATTPEMEKKVQELIRDKDSDIDKIKAIYYFVAQKIRYMGVTTEEEAPGFEPHDVSITFNNRYGVCRDKAALLVAMLKIAGFKAYPVLIAVGPKLDKEVPLSYFNHAVSCVELSDGKLVFMDATDESSKDIFPSYLCGRSYLVAKEDGATLETTPIVPARENLVEIETNGTLSEDGTIDALSVIKFDGINDSMYRGHLAKLSSKEKRNFFENVLRRAVPNAELFYYSVLPENLLDMSVNLTARIRYFAKKSIVSGENISSLDMPWLGMNIGIVNYIIGQTGLIQRKYPLVTEIACGSSEKITISFPESLKVNTIPTFKEIDSPAVTFKRELKQNDGKLEAEGEFLINVVEFSPKEYLDLKENLKAIEFNNKKRILLTSESLNSNLTKNLPDDREIDARILSRKFEVTLKADGSRLSKYQTKTKVLTYNGKKDNSEVKITYNPVWENVEIVKAQVISPSGKVHIIDSTEINIMDSSWAASAPRYPAEKIMVLSFPGVEIGSTIDLEYEITNINEPFYSDIFLFRSSYPIDSYEVSLNIAKERNLHFFNIEKKNTDAVSETITEDDEYTYFKWNAANMSAVVEEVSFPPSWVYLPAILVSEGNWKDYTDIISNRFEEVLKDNPKTDEMVRKLLDGKNTEEEKIKAIRDFIAINILKTGPSFTDLPLDYFSKPDTTLTDGYGNSADTAVLYAAMLRKAGFKTDFIFVSDLPYLDQVISPIYDLPQRRYFNDILVRFTDPKGNSIYLNDTDQYSIYGSVRSEGKAGIFFADASLIKIEAIESRNTYSETLLTSDIFKDGSAEISVKKKFYGNDFGEQNRFLSLMTDEDRYRFYKEVIANISQSAVSISDFEYDFSSYPGTESFKIKIPDYCVQEADYAYFNLYTGISRIFKLGTREKFYPYYISSEYSVKIANTIRFPDNMDRILIKPLSCNLTLPGNGGAIYLSSISAGKESKTYYDVIEYKIKPAIIFPEEYTRLVDIQDYLSSEHNSMYLFNIKQAD